MRKQNYLIGTDIGTSSIKGVLLRADGSGIVKSGKRSFEYRTASDGTVELAPEDYLSACCSLYRELAAAVPADGELAAVCTATASGNLLLLDEKHKPVSPIYGWQDKRTANEVREILGEDFDPDAYFLSTGWRFDLHTFPLATLCRLRAKEPSRLDAAKYVTMSTEYLLYTLTGAWGLSTSEGTPFYLIDQKTGEYRKDIIGKLGLENASFPPVIQAGEIVGGVTETGAKLSGLPAGTPFVAGTFDHPSAARGVGVFEPGQLLLSCGTSWVGFFPVENREIAEKNGMLIDPFLSGEGGAWAGMVSLASVSARLSGYIRKYIVNEGNIYKTFAAYSAESEPGAGGLRITLSEEDDEDVIRSYPKCHIARAIMEGIVRMLGKDLDRMKAGGVCATSAVMVGGPTECPLWTKVIEEKTGIPVKILHGAYAGSMGAAAVAGIGAGLWKDEKEAFTILNPRT